MSSIRSITLTDFRGFTLCLFEQGTSPQIHRWNGTEFFLLDGNQPIVSSSVQLENVKKNRGRIFQKIIQEQGDTREAHMAFHRSHTPRKSYLSTCMHREDAQTVSFSHIQCEPDKVTFAYTGDSPCSTSDITEVSIRR